MILSNIIPLTVFLTIQNMSGRREMVEVPALEEDVLFPMCTNDSWYLKSVRVEDDNASNELIPWSVNLLLAEKDEALSARQIQVFKNQQVHFPICAPNLIVLKLDIKKEYSAIEDHSKHRVRREVSVEQTLDSHKFVQVIYYDFGIERTLRIDKSKMRAHASTTPPPTTSATTTMSSSDTTTIIDILSSKTSTTSPTTPPPVIPKECLEYKTMLEQMVRWAREEVYKIDAMTSDKSTCKMSLPAKKFM